MIVLLRLQDFCMCEYGFFLFWGGGGLGPNCPSIGGVTVDVTHEFKNHADRKILGI